MAFLGARHLHWAGTLAGTRDGRQPGPAQHGRPHGGGPNAHAEPGYSCQGWTPTLRLSVVNSGATLSFLGPRPAGFSRQPAGLGRGAGPWPELEEAAAAEAGLQRAARAGREGRAGRVTSPSRPRPHGPAACGDGGASELAASSSSPNSGSR